MAADDLQVFGQCVAGGFIVLALALLKATCEQKPSSVLSPACLVYGCDGHWLYRLYAPSWFTNARFYSLNRVGASALSNEIASGSIFLP